MSGKAVGWAFDRPEKLTPTQRYVLVAIADNADPHGRAWPSRKELGRKTGLNLSTVYRALDALQAAGLFDERVEDGRETFYLPVSQGANRSHGANELSQGAKTDLQGANPPITEPSVEPSVEPSALLPSAVQQVFDHWASAMGKNGATRLDATRRRRIEARLREGLTVPDLCRAIDGCAGSDYHMKRGRHARRDGPVYDELKMILRDRPQVENLIAIASDSDRAGRDHSLYDRTEN